MVLSKKLILERTSTLKGKNLIFQWSIFIYVTSTYRLFSDWFAVESSNIELKFKNRFNDTNQITGIGYENA